MFLDKSLSRPNEFDIERFLNAACLLGTQPVSDDAAEFFDACV